MRTTEQRIETALMMFAEKSPHLPDYLAALARSEGIDCPVAWVQFLHDNDAPDLSVVVQSELLGGVYSSAYVTQPDDDERRLLALAEYLDCVPEDLAEEGSGPYGHGTTYAYGRQEYAIMTEEEADAAWDESLNSYLDDCVLPELPETAQHYFDREAWKRDARHDGRGHSLGSYDGDENDAREFLVYRLN